MAFLGGASRFDAIQIVPLRVTAALFLIPALLFLTRQSAARHRALLLIFGLYVVLVAVQLLPLPPSLWQSLPGRDGIAAMDDLLGLSDSWRPLSLTPTRTWNVLGSLAVPGAALLLAVAMARSSQVLLKITGAVGLAGAVIGILQVISGKSSPLYFYELTNFGSPVGFFANENHSGIFLACTLLILARLGLDARKTSKGPGAPAAYAGAFALVLFCALIGGSRAGFAASAGAVLISAFMVWIARPAKRSRSSPRREVEAGVTNKVVVVVPIVLLGLAVAAFLSLDRAPALTDILAEDTFADMRWEIYPIQVEMMQMFWLTGSGFGSFEQVYQIFEPTRLLMPAYVNQAHNDWIQILIEGGIAAGVLLAVLLVWIVFGIVALARSRSSPVILIFWISIFMLVGAASLIDYPLRTPLFQAIMVWLLVAFALDVRDTKATISRNR